MKMILKAFGLWLVAVMAVLPASAADTVKLGDVEIALTKPEEFCAFDRSQPADARAVQMIEGSLAGRNRLLGSYALCDELPKWRTGKVPLLTEFVQHQVMLALMNRPIPKPYATFKGQFCQQFKNSGQKVIDKISPEIDKRISAMSEKIKVNEQRMFGVLDAPDNGCVVMMLQRIKAETGASFVQLVTFTPVIVKTRLIFSYMFVPFKPDEGGQPTVDRLLANVEVFEKANAK